MVPIKTAAKWMKAVILPLLLGSCERERGGKQPSANWNFLSAEETALITRVERETEHHKIARRKRLEKEQKELPAKTPMFCPAGRL